MGTTDITNTEDFIPNRHAHTHFFRYDQTQDYDEEEYECQNKLAHL